MRKDWQAWVQERRALIDVAMGRAPADIVLRNGRWVSVQTGEILPGTDIAIKGQRIAYIGPDASHTIGEDTQVVDVDGLYMTPGLLDAHMHIESGMVTVTEFVRAVVPWGTTGMFVDPHEIANVFGLEGIRLMVEEARQQPIHVWVQVPSCVPSAPGLETPGATIGPEEVAEALRWEGVIGLGEMMNFPGVFNGDEKMLAEMAVTYLVGKTVGGHYASHDLGLPFHGYAAGGAEDDHEGTRMEDALARARQGMKVMMRLGSGWKDVAAQARAITEGRLDPRRFLLCTDDCHAETLVEEGHMDRVVREAIAQGIPPVVAIQMATLNVAEHFRVDREVGLLAPGRYADILLVSDLPSFRVERVMARGRWVAEKGRLLIDLPAYTYPTWATQSVRLARALTPQDFVLPSRSNPTVRAHVIGVVENQAPTRHLVMEVPVVNGQVRPSPEQDIAKVALVERHRGTGQVQVGLVHGFGFTAPCAVASTVAHDSHHLLVVGTDEEQMALAVNKLAEVGGGQVVVKEGEVIGLVELPIAGLMSTERADVVAHKARSVLEGFRACGCTMENPNMQLSLLALVVIPELRISDKGLVDVTRFRVIPVLEE